MEKIKKIKKLIVVLLTFSIILGLWSPIGIRAEGNSPLDIVAAMTTEEKISQMLMVSTRYIEKDNKLEGITELPQEMADYLSDNHFGGVILFAQNTVETEQTVRLIDSIQTANASGGAKAQLLVALDQEGGRITRLNECVQGPGNMALAATGSDDDISEMYKIIGTEVSALGFNVDFCPDADINNNPANPVIGLRSFSDNSKIVANGVVLAQKALQETGVIDCPKHFPGHGDTATDSHSGLPCIDLSYEELMTTELFPFQAGIDNGTEMIMTAHIQYPQIERDTYVSKETGEEIYLPATLSDTIISDILRSDMRYDGVVVTDAMNMDAIAKHFDPLDAVTLAINAGVDIILMPADISSAEGRDQLETEIKQLAQKADSDEAFMIKINTAVLRILKLKEKHGLLSAYDGSGVETKVANAKTVVSTRANHDKEWEITKHAITMVKNEKNTLPINKEDKKTVILTAYNDELYSMEYAVDLLREEGRLPEGATYEIYSYYDYQAPEKWPELMELIKDADNVIAVSEMSSLDYLTGEAATVIDELIAKTHEQGSKFILMSASLPYDVARFQEADAIVVVYGARSINQDPREDKEPMKRYGPNMAAGLYLMLQGDESPQGMLPVNIPLINSTKDGYVDGYEYLYDRDYGLVYNKPIEVTVTFKVENGSWDDGTSEEKTLKFNGLEEDEFYLKAEDIPLVGTKPGDGYKEGSWDLVPSVETMIAGDITYTYSYLAEDVKYTKEWVNGQWYDQKGNTDYKYKGSWKQNKTGFWFEDESGWYPVNCWQKINQKWYYFDGNGYLAQNQYVGNWDGYTAGYWWVDKDGVWTGSEPYTWHISKDKRWWFGIASGNYVSNEWKQISGKWYYFDKDGYLLTSQYIGTYWVNENGEWVQ